ncbi:unnamed protein product [Parnassius apollo]|uniref:(apollo) hypothetical protein n=1 Tax=Parnassius apollo TaxID=110799 RepID=A0A8S3WUH6_PARAO|nr:unnamed protein product [Parnassius apollo]
MFLTGGEKNFKMKLSLVFELLLIFVLLAFAASKNIGRKKTTKTGIQNKNSDVKIEDNSINRYCKCAELFCNCCRDFQVPLVNLSGAGCATLMYLNNDKMSISLSFGRKVITNRTLSSRKPSPVCMPLPGGISKFCGRVYNIARSGEEFRACLGLELQSKNTIEAALRVSCFKFGPRGVSSEPADPLPLVPQDEKNPDDDEDDYEDDEDDDDDDDLGLSADDDYEGITGDDDDDDGELDAVNDVGGADYTGFSLLGEDLLGDLFGSGGKKTNKSKNKQAPISSSTTRRPRPSRRPTRRPATRVTTVRPFATRSTTVRVRPVTQRTRRPTIRPIGRPSRRPPSPTSVVSSTISSKPVALVDSDTPTKSVENKTTVDTINQESVSNTETISPLQSFTTVKPGTTFEDPSLEMSVAHITGQLAVMPITPVLPDEKESNSKIPAHTEVNYEKIETVTPNKPSTASLKPSESVNDDMIQIVQNLDSHSEEVVTEKGFSNPEEKRSYGTNHENSFLNNYYEGLTLSKNKHKGGGFQLDDLDVLDLTKIGESVGQQLGIFGRNKRQYKNKHFKNRKGSESNNDYSDIIGDFSETVGSTDHEDSRNRKDRRRQNKMMRGDVIVSKDRKYEVIHFRVPNSVWKQALNPTPILKSPVTIVLPVQVPQDEEDEVLEEEVEDETPEAIEDVTPANVNDELDIQAVTQNPVTTISTVSQGPIEENEVNDTPVEQVEGQVVRFPCNCVKRQCGCCTGSILERFRMKACGNITFVPEDFIFDVKLSVNNNTVVRRRVSASDPPPICFNPRRAPFVRVCAEISDIRVRNGNAFACLDINADIGGFPIYSASFRCFGFGSSGVQTGLKPKPISSGPKPVNLFGNGNNEDSGGFLENAAGTLLGDGNGGGLFGRPNDSGPLDDIGDAIGELFE